MKNNNGWIKTIILGLYLAAFSDFNYKLGWMQGQLDANVETIKIGKYFTITKNKIEE